MAREEWSDIRGVFFDLYGTLMVYGDMDAADRAWCENQHATLEDYGLALSVEEFRERAQGMFDASAPPVEEAGLTLAEQRCWRSTRSWGCPCQSIRCGSSTRPRSENGNATSPSTRPRRMCLPR